jgi:DNA-binding NarL/FixJ family response regulator
MKILVCDDHALFREGVAHALGELAADAKLLEAADGAEALRLARAHADLDLVLLDLNMPGTDGWTGLARLQKACPTLPVVILSASEEPGDARRAIDAGAAGFVPKSTRGPVLRAALQLVLSGGVYLPPNLLLEGAAAPTTRSAAARRKRAEGLTERQLEVLRLMSRGLTNTEIGNLLGVALGTVKAHITSIFEVLDVSNRTEAALVMRDLGLDRDDAGA